MFLCTSLHGRTSVYFTLESARVSEMMDDSYDDSIDTTNLHSLLPSFLPSPPQLLHSLLPSLPSSTSHYYTGIYMPLVAMLSSCIARSA